MLMCIEAFLKLGVLCLAAVLYGLGVMALILLCAFVAFCVFSRKSPRMAWQAVKNFLKENFHD